MYEYRAFCTVEDCARPLVARGLCANHYAVERRSGRLPLRQHHPRQSTRDRLLKSIDQGAGPDACWPWTGATRAKGYGSAYILDGSKRVETSAHRAMYIATHGPIPDGLHVLHGCHNPPCCNPAHLRLGTHVENMADRHEQGERHPRGNWSPRAIVLDETTVAAIRADYRYRVKGHTMRAVAARFGIDQAIVFQIVNHRGRWAASA